MGAGGASRYEMCLGWLCERLGDVHINSALTPDERVRSGVTLTPTPSLSLTPTYTRLDSVAAGSGGREERREEERDREGQGGGKRDRDRRGGEERDAEESAETQPRVLAQTVETVVATLQTGEAALALRENSHSTEDREALAHERSSGAGAWIR